MITKTSPKCKNCKEEVEPYANGNAKSYCNHRCYMADIQRYTGETPKEALERRKSLQP